MLLINPLMFCWKDFQRSILSSNNEEAREKSKRTAGILRVSVRALDVNKNDEYD
ncbi:MAG: hypothetical protein ACTS73_01280 [Arsenophonus sp. NEOnobi-MAG3]